MPGIKVPKRTPKPSDDDGYVPKVNDWVWISRPNSVIRAGQVVRILRDGRVSIRLPGTTVRLVAEPGWLCKHPQNDW